MIIMLNFVDTESPLSSFFNSITSDNVIQESEVSPNGRLKQFGQKEQEKQLVILERAMFSKCNMTVEGGNEVPSQLCHLIHCITNHI